MAPKDKARNVLARLHREGKTGEQLFLIVLSVRAAYAEIGPYGYPEFPLVVIAKQAKQLRGASGTHFRDSPYRFPSKYPRPRGLYLRLLGEMIEETANIDRDTIETVAQAVRPAVRQAQKSAWEEAKARQDEEERTIALIRLMGRVGSLTVGTS
ncbi:MAG: hypothetical protein M9945_02320 [Aquamicrobium sp.]|uniref:hypothetical protein n=1 Tax=Aquamicrobium sp. TaxID=1872579 RepID=UPI00349EC340|nr:hypothetical protein [Aquamicrobium sp.]